LVSSKLLATLPHAMAEPPTDAQLYNQGPTAVGSHGPISKEELAKARQSLEALKRQHGILEPERSGMDDADIEWRFGRKPDYTLANYHYMTGKTMDHQPGTLPYIVQNLVKTWEMEASHKTNPSQWASVGSEGCTFQANGYKVHTWEEAMSAGNYNWLMHGVQAPLWDAANTSWSESHDIFRNAFPAFAWEVLEVFSGPPTVAFTWRHWGVFTGEYKGNRGEGQTVNMYGFAVATVSDSLQLTSVRVYYDPEEFLKVLEGKAPASSASRLGTARFMGGQTTHLDRIGSPLALPKPADASGAKEVAAEASPQAGTTKGVCPFLSGGE